MEIKIKNIIIKSWDNSNATSHCNVEIKINDERCIIDPIYLVEVLKPFINIAKM